MVKLQYPDFVFRKVIGLQRKLLWFYGGNHYLRVAEFPKSGGTWLCQMLSALTDKTFHRNQLVGFSSSVLLSHFILLNSKTKAIWLLRDGRDVLISCYYHFLIGHEYSNELMVSNWRKKMPFSDYENIRKNLSSFIVTFHSNYQSGGMPCDWGSHARYFSSKSGIVAIRYEDLLLKTSEQLGLIMDTINVNFSENKMNSVIQMYAFEKRSKGKNKGSANSFLRKGIIGDWKNHFDRESANTFDQFYGDVLIEMGYEPNREWLKNYQ